MFFVIIGIMQHRRDVRKKRERREHNKRLQQQAEHQASEAVANAHKAVDELNSLAGLLEVKKSI